jgi:hypothetical protein
VTTANANRTQVNVPWVACPKHIVHHVDSCDSPGIPEFTKFGKVTTMPGTNNGSTGPKRLSLTPPGVVPHYSLARLTRSELELIAGALWTVVHRDGSWDAEDAWKAEQILDRIDTVLP